MKDEAGRSSDPMIEAALYQLIATQIQREKMAEVQADFAFTIIEPSAASDLKVWPSTTLFCLLAAFGDLRNGGNLHPLHTLYFR